MASKIDIGLNLDAGNVKSGLNDVSKEANKLANTLNQAQKSLDLSGSYKNIKDMMKELNKQVQVLQTPIQVKVDVSDVERSFEHIQKKIRQINAESIQKRISYTDKKTIKETDELVNSFLARHPNGFVANGEDERLFKKYSRKKNQYLGNYTINSTSEGPYLDASYNYESKVKTARLKMEQEQDLKRYNESLRKLAEVQELELKARTKNSYADLYKETQAALRSKFSGPELEKEFRKLASDAFQGKWDRVALKRDIINDSKDSRPHAFFHDQTQQWFNIREKQFKEEKRNYQETLKKMASNQFKSEVLNENAYKVDAKKELNAAIKRLSGTDLVEENVIDRIKQELKRKNVGANTLSDLLSTVQPALDYLNQSDEIRLKVEKERLEAARIAEKQAEEDRKLEEAYAKKKAIEKKQRMKDYVDGVKKEKGHTIGRNELYPDDGNLSATQKAHNEDVMWRRNMAEMKRDSYDTMATSSIINSIYGGFGNNGFLNADQKKKQLILGQVPALIGGLGSLDTLLPSILGFTGNSIMSGFSAKGEMAKMTAVMKRVSETEAFSDWMNQIGMDSKSYKKMKKKDRQKLMDRFMRTDESIVDDVEVKGKDGQVRRQRVNYKTRAMKELSKDTAFMGGLPLKGLGILAAVGAVEKLVGAIKNLGSESVKSFENVQSLQTQLSVVFGSDISSKQAFNEIEAYAKKSPFGVETMTQQAILLKQSGVYGSDLMDVMGRIGDLASGNAEKMKSISEVYARVLSSTTVTARDMRQLANAGVPSYRALTESFKNMSEEERTYRGLPQNIQQSQIRSMLQSGKVTSEDFRRMIEGLTNEGGTFEGAVERGSKTLLARKQNLSDAKDMARAALGEWLTKLGGYSTNDSIYGGWLNFKEEWFAAEEDFFRHQNIEKAYESAVINVKKAEIIQEATEKMSSWGYDLDQYLGAEKHAQALNERMSSGYDRFVETYGDSLIKRSSTSSEQMNEIKAMLDYLETPAWKVPDYIWRQRTPHFDELSSLSSDEKKGYAEALRDAFEKLEQEYKIQNPLEWKNDENYYDYLAGHLQRAGESARDFSDAITAASTSVVNLRTKAMTDFDKGSYGSLLAGDTTYFNNQKIKNRLYEELNEFGANIKPSGQLDLNLYLADTLDEYLSVYKDFIDGNSEALGLTPADIIGVNGEMTKEGAENLGIFAENLRQLFLVLQGTPDVIGDDNLTKLFSLRYDALKILDSSFTGENLVNAVNGMYEKYSDLERGLAASLTKKEITQDNFDSFTEALKTVFLNNTYSSAGIDKINARQTSLWHSILGNAVGIDAARVKAAGGRESMNLYATNLSQRNEFSTIAKSLLASGTSLKDISDKLVRTGTGYDGTQLFDWQTSIIDIEKMASQKSIATQQSLIQAYEQQIDTLNSLEVAGVATVDQWSELHDLSQALGSGFSLAAEELADGSYRFTEATIQAAEDMKRELNAKKFQEQMKLAYRQVYENLRNEGMASNLTNAALSGNLELGSGYLSASETGTITNLYSTLVADQIENEFSNMENRLKDLSSTDVESLESLVKALGPEFAKLITTSKIEESGYSSTAVTADNEFFVKYNELYNEELRLWKEAGGSGKRSDYENDPEGLKQFNEAVELYKSMSKGGTGTLADNVWIRFEEYLKEKLGDSFDEQKSYFKTSSSGSYLAYVPFFQKATSGGIKIDGLDAETLKSMALKSSEMDEKELDVFMKIFNVLAGQKDSLELINSQLITNRTLAAKQEYWTNARNVNELLGGYSDWILEGSKPEFSWTDITRGSEGYSGVRIAPLKEISALLGWNEKLGLDTGFKKLSEYQLKNPNEVSDAVFKKGFLSMNLNQSSSSASRMLEEGGYNKEYLKELQRQLEAGDITAKQLRENLTEAFGKDFLTDFNTELDKIVVSMEYMKNVMEDFGQTVTDALLNSGLDMFNSMTHKAGEDSYKLSANLMDSSEHSKEMGKALAEVNANLIDSISSAAVNAGFNIAAGAALEGNWGMVAAGLALSAAGGFGNFLSGFINAALEDKDDSSDKFEKLSKLKDNLADLLAQAREDAGYYEATLRDKRAIAANDSLSSITATKVNDMILTDKGVFSTDPKDTIMAMKDPASLMGPGSMSFSPNINLKFINQSGSSFAVSDIESSVNANGDIDIIATIDAAVKKGIASGEYDEAYDLMRSRRQGVVISG